MKNLTLTVITFMENVDPDTHGCNEVLSDVGGVCVSDTGENVNGMGETICETGELACGIEVIACPNGERLEEETHWRLPLPELKPGVPIRTCRSLL